MHSLFEEHPKKGSATALWGEGFKLGRVKPFITGQSDSDVLTFLIGGFSRVWADPKLPFLHGLGCDCGTSKIRKSHLTKSKVFVEFFSLH